ncbi:MAG: M20 family metallopeptidase [Actinomycetota bacterium]|nr:M20 family metallopeptidase [Actinomycetota bacterium]
MSETDLVAILRGRVPQMLESLERLVEIESPTSDVSATEACARVADDIGTELLGERAERVERDGRVHLRWAFGSTRDIVLVGHLDTVWPLGTLAAWPFEVRGEMATGPGCFDMKAGVVQLFHALAGLDDLDGIVVLLTTDEEIGSPSSRALIEETVKGARAVLVLEPSAGGALKTERKGSSAYVVEVRGRAAHAGLEPEKGINAAIEAAHQVLAIAELADPELRTTVSPNVVMAGTATNTIPALATVRIDVRVTSEEEQERVDAALRALLPVLPGTTVSVERTGSAPPMPRSATSELFTLAGKVGEGLGLPPLDEASVGGGSDGNYIASLGVPVLDGLGAVGGGAHAEGEYVEIDAMPERAALVAGLVTELRKT